MRIDNCRSCGARLIWCLTEAGNRMPVDAEPVEDGNLAMFMVGGTPHCKALPKIDHADEDLMAAVLPVERYKSHFATCVHAAQHRKAKTHGSKPGGAGEPSA